MAGGAAIWAKHWAIAQCEALTSVRALSLSLRSRDEALMAGGAAIVHKPIR